MRKILAFVVGVVFIGFGMSALSVPFGSLEWWQPIVAGLCFGITDAAFDT